MNDDTKHITYITNHEKNSFRRIIINRNYKTKRYYIDFFVAGYKYNDGKEMIEFLNSNEPVILVREIFNPYDRFAVAIYERGFTRLGYIPKVISPLISYKLEDKKNKIHARIKNIRLEEDDECKIEIRIFIDIVKKAKKNS
ncbi:HIRAN domain-containing protein [uncultured Brachyspira sp.]|uniref:HIRAN domain-containing protein n=1 Tax=uncultured Brachyspira sp. TaxID=221953 RepID=UPI002621D8C3|nr:HIRAN domain-containing protein [uncultured Brachyspira sp.]